VMVVYPSAHWYTFVDLADVDDIIDQHLLGGCPVERLLLDPAVGR
jgi:(2Fe-2S) ferredoxin